MLPTGRGSVAFRAPEGRAFADVEAEVRRLLDADGGPPVRAEQDEFGFTWLVVTSDPVDLPSVVTDLHAVNTSLVDAGFGPQLLCSLVSFTRPAGARRSRWSTCTSAARSTRSPLPGGDAQQRDNVLELRVRDLLARRAAARGRHDAAGSPSGAPPGL